MESQHLVCFETAEVDQLAFCCVETKIAKGLRAWAWADQTIHTALSGTTPEVRG